MARPATSTGALDWSTTELGAQRRQQEQHALWIVDAASKTETTLSFEACRRRFLARCEFLRAQGQRGDHLVVAARQCDPLWETMRASIKIGVVVIPATH